MPKPRVVLGMLSIGMMTLAPAVVVGQDYPNKPIRMISGEVGGGPDFVGRVIGPGLSASLGQPVIVDNRGTVFAIEAMARAAPDGYTVLVAGSSFWLLPLLKKVSYDPVTDFSPVTQTDTSPNILVVNSSLPAKTVQELITLAKTEPGTLNYGTGSDGASNHLAAELFKSMAGINIVRIPYKGQGQALTDLIGGQVQLVFPNAGGWLPHVKAGRLRALAVTSATPSPLFPDLPTIAASGVPGYESVARTAIWAPAKTPAVIINRLNQEIVRVLNRAEVKEKFFGAAIQVVGSSPQELAATMKSDMARMGKVIKDAGIKID